jgi:hypothetical protein
MSKIKAALVTLILGTSSAAMAAPAVSFTAQANLAFGTQVGPNVRDHRTQPAYPMPVNPGYAWIALGSQMSLSSGKTTVKPSLGSISQLRLEASAGSSYVKKVQVKFRDGSVQNVKLNQWLTTRAPLDLSLTANRSGVDTIVITGSAQYNARYQLFAQGVHIVEVPPVVTPPIYQGYSLGTGMSFAGSDGRRIFTVGADKGTFSTLRIQGESGSTYIEQVLIRFEGGQEQLLRNIDQTLGRGQTVNIRLDGNGTNKVHGVYIYTSNGPIAAGTFNATLL